MEPQICGDLEEKRLRKITAVRFPGRGDRGSEGPLRAGTEDPRRSRLKGAAICSRDTFDRTKFGHEKDGAPSMKRTAHHLQLNDFGPQVLASRKLSIDPSLSLGTPVYATCALE